MDMEIERRQELLHQLRQASMSAQHVSMYPERYSQAAANAIYAKVESLEKKVGRYR
jgi:hypothetical protein